MNNSLKTKLKMSQIDEQRFRTQPQETDLIRLLFRYGNKPFDSQHTVAEQMWSEIKWTRFTREILYKTLDAFLRAEPDEDLRDNPDKEIAEMADRYFIPEIKISPLWEKYGHTIPEIKEENYKPLVSSAILRYNLTKISAHITDTRHDIKEKKAELKKLEERLEQWKLFRKNLADQINSCNGTSPGA